MSNFTRPTIRPDTGEIEEADWLDDYFGRHKYGIRFKDGKVFTQDEVMHSTEEEVMRASPE